MCSGSVMPAVIGSGSAGLTSTVYSTPSLPGCATHWPPVMYCHSVSLRKASHMPPCTPPIPTPCSFTAWSTGVNCSFVIVPIVQIGTIRSNCVRSLSLNASKVSEMVTSTPRSRSEPPSRFATPSGSWPSQPPQTISAFVILHSPLSQSNFDVRTCLYQTAPGHLRGFRQTHQVQNRRRNIRQNAIIVQFIITFANHKQRYRANRVIGVRLPGHKVNHALTIAMIGGDNSNAAFLQHLLYQPAHTLIHRFHSLDRRFQRTRVPDHVRVGKVNQDKIVVVCFQPFQRSGCEFISAHFRLEIVGRHLWRRDDSTIFARPGFFHAPVEEESNVRIFFRLSRMILLQAVLADPFRQRVFRQFDWKQNSDRKPFDVL